MPPDLRVLSRSFDFAGRSPRGEFWWFTLVDWLLRVLLVVLEHGDNRFGRPDEVAA